LAAITAILKALRRVIKRDLQTIQSIKLNNFFLFAVLLTYSSLASQRAPWGAAPFLVLLGLLLLFPLSSDPLSKIPPVRLALWPLTRRDRRILRLASFGVSPALWLAVLILLLTSSVAIALLFLAVVVGVHSLSALGGLVVRRAPLFNLQRYVPQLPGRLGGMIRNNVRQMLSVLDLYVALTLSIAANAYRWLSPHPEPAAFPIMAVLVALALSTYPQCLFGLDSDSALARYRLLPLRGWQILLAKDAAYLAILLMLVLPLSPGAGMTFGLAALAIGRYPSLALYSPQHRWRFTSGDFRFGVLQMLAGTGLGLAEHQIGEWFLLAAAVGYAASLYIGGRHWDRGTTLGESA
jgi:hypothetical protein